MKVIDGVIEDAESAAEAALIARASARSASKIHEIKRTSLMNVPQKLRELAKLVDAAQMPTAVVVVGHRDGKVSVYGYGERTAALQVSGWLARAQEALTAGSGDDADGYQWEPPAA